MVYHSPNVARKAMLNLLKGRIETFFLCPSVWQSLVTVECSRMKGWCPPLKVENKDNDIAKISNQTS